MTVWEVVDNAATADGDDLVLSRCGDEWQVHTGPSLLMSSDEHHSEELLAALAIKKAGSVQRVLVGGLGMGFTLRAALERLPSNSEVVLAETSSALVRWNRTCLAHLADRPLEDPRVRLELGDVADRIADANADYDVILLDVDNGPNALVHATNDRLYGPEGSRAALRSLRPGGVLAVWARWPDERYLQQLRVAGFKAEALTIRAVAHDLPTYTVFMAMRPRSAGAGRGARASDPSSPAGRARDELAELAHPQHRARDRDPQQPVAGGDCHGAERDLQEGHVDHRGLQRGRKQHRAPQPAVDEQPPKHGALVGARVEDGE
jgi:hypothetical protein